MIRLAAGFPDSGATLETAMLRQLSRGFFCASILRFDDEEVLARKTGCDE
ncbi:hypothetical protein [Henriciella aquimarina]|nr:hypothetical protein [Henriciella aquimarina]